jgi:membrane protein required for beta-lactamase induction
MFAVGFVIMNLLYMIPVVGFIILVITTSLGFGAVMVTVYRNLDALRGESKNNE